MSGTLVEHVEGSGGGLIMLLTAFVLDDNKFSVLFNAVKLLGG